MPAKNTGAILQRLRSLMSNSKYVTEPLHAYIVPSGDAHLSEYIATCDQRRAFVSGFTGSAGTAVVTTEAAALWTDGRYFLQAGNQLDENWTLMKDGQPETPSQGDWLCKVLPPGGKVGVDPFLMSAASWDPLEKTLADGGFGMVPVSQNLIDLVWDDQPAPPNNPLLTLSFKYTGMKWQDKVKKLRSEMAEKKASILVLTALDEVAYLFNLRGADIEFNPVFFSYAIITTDSLLLFIDETKISSDVRNHLDLDSTVGDGVKVTVLPYGSVRAELENLVTDVKAKAWISNRTSSQALFSLVPKNQRVNQPSPAALMKAVKNTTEINGMKNAHIKDAVALCEYLHWLENEVGKGQVTEVTGADQLQKFREAQEDFVSLSFDTISGVGSNGAIIHYRASEETDKVLTKEEIYLCDSGAQYRDGTTDVTRTVHFGTPTRHEQECFTRVLKGHIALARAVFPRSVKGVMLDTLARTALWEAGLDYLHGTGHGVGAFLNVHEGPCGISYRPRPDDAGLEEGMILSDEPGYYEDGKFGIRIESLVLVKKAGTKFNFKDRGFLTFEAITLVPIQAKMILPEMLSEQEISWLNEYHEQVRDVVGAAMRDQGKKEVLDWLMRETQTLG